MSSSVTVAVAQVAPILLDARATTARACAAIGEAGALGARIVALPEALIPGYPYWTLFLDPLSGRPLSERLQQQAVQVPGPEIDALCAACRAARCAAVIGITERSGGTLYCTQVFITDDGSVAGRRRKLMPTMHEKLLWGWGDGSDFQIHGLAGLRTGALICYEHAHALYRYALQGENEQVHVAAWPGGLPGMDAIIDAAVRSYAWEGQCFVLNATSVMTAGNLAVLGAGGNLPLLTPGRGYSGIVSPDAQFIAGPVTDGECVLASDIDPAMIAGIKIMVDTAGHYARPDVIRTVVDRAPRRPLGDAPAEDADGM